MNFASILRAILIIAGGFLVGQHFGNTVIDMGYWDIVVGGIMAIVAGISSWRAKLLLPDQKISFLRTSITFLAGIVVASGKLSPESVEMWSGIIITVASYFIGNQVAAKNE